jgi:hypothetical protein
VRADLFFRDAAGEPAQRIVDDSRSARRRLAHLALDVRRPQRQLCQTRVREAHALQPPHARRVSRQPFVAQPLLGGDNLGQPLEEPGIEPGQLPDPLDRESLPKSLRGNQQPVRRRLAQRILDFARVGVHQLADTVEPA